MLASSPPVRLSPPLRRTLVFVLVSLALHFGVYACMRWVWHLPDPGFELTLPTTIELGMIEGSELVVAAGSEPAPKPEEPAPPAADGDQLREPTPKPKPKPKPPAPDAQRASASDRSTGGGLTALAPPGAQLALRVDLDRIRDSALAEDVRTLLGAIPDVRMVLEGSEIDPVRDLSRLFLASPNLQRSKLVVAGQYRGDEALPRAAAENLARAAGETLSWETRGNVPVVAWHDLDRTDRVLALIGAHAFAITRTEDLARVLGIAQALAKKSAAKRGQRASSAAEALLAMDRDQVVAFSVENAKLFTRGATAHVPERLTVSVFSPVDQQVRLGVSAEFASEAEAAAAREFWDGLRKQYARSPLLALIGLGGPLNRTQLEVAQKNVDATSSLSLDEVRVILRFVSEALGGRPRAPAPGPDDQPEGAPTTH